MYCNFKRFLFVASCFLIVTNALAKTTGPWDLDELFQAPKWKTTDMAPQEGLEGILYESVPYLGEKVEVFAYYSTPEGDMPEGGWPAVVCVHGGGGTAFDLWVKKWNNHGYAAISMDLEGHFPIRINEDKKARVSTPNPGPVRVETFEDYEKPMAEQWYFHAVTQVIKAHSLLASFPEVNADKIGITGISWGGILTSTIMGLDNRFKFAIPVYGCGYLPDSDGFQGENIKPGAQTEFVFANFDGSAYFKNAKIPTLWVNGTNDRHFPMPSTQLSSQAIKGDASLCFIHGMKHGHPQGWAPKEIYAFADYVIKGAQELAVLRTPKQKGTMASVKVTNGVKIGETQLFYTLDDGLWKKREWQSIGASVDDVNITADIPEGATAYYFSVTDESDLTVTSQLVEL